MRSWRAGVLFAAMLWPGVALAQDEPPPPPVEPVPPPPVFSPTPAPQNGGVTYVIPGSPPPDVHAPKYSLWVGARASFVAWGFGLYVNEHGDTETTGNYLKNGVATQIDVGVRVARRFVPYVFWDHGFMGQGRRFEGSDASTRTDFYGIGFRYISGNVDKVGLLADLAFGKRVITVESGSQELTMSGLELFRLGLGAEIRLKTLLTIEPLVSLSSGVMNDTDGNIDFACVKKGPCVDGLTKPTYENGQSIPAARAYVVFSLGLGVHFDLFGQ